MPVALDMGTTGLLFVVAILAALIVPALPVIGVPLAAAATAALAFRREGPSAMLAAVVAAAATALVFGPFTGLMVGVVLVVTGPMAARFLRTWEPWRVLALLTVVVLGMSVGTLALEVLVSGHTITQLFEQVTRESLKTWGPFLQRDPKLAAEQVRFIRLFMLELWPGVTFVGSVLTAALTIKVIAWTAERSGAHVRALPKLEELDVSWHVVWFLIVALGLLAFARFTKGAYPWVEVVGLNIMLPVRFALFVQGLAVFAWLYRKAGFGPVTRGVSYVLLLFVEPALPLAGFAGLADLWLDLRRLRKRDDVPSLGPDRSGTQI